MVPDTIFPPLEKIGVPDFSRLAKTEILGEMILLNHTAHAATPVLPYLPARVCSFGFPFALPATAIIDWSNGVRGVAVVLLFVGVIAGLVFYYLWSNFPDARRALYLVSALTILFFAGGLWLGINFGILLGAWVVVLLILRERSLVRVGGWRVALEYLFYLLLFLGLVFACLFFDIPRGWWRPSMGILLAFIYFFHSRVMKRRPPGAFSYRPPGAKERSAPAPTRATATPASDVPFDAVAFKPMAPADHDKIKAALTLGDFYRQEGKRDEAIEAYEDGLRADPTNAELRARLEQMKRAQAA
jgi:tetratricopeptide (TPR) repeat protein